MLKLKSQLNAHYPTMMPKTYRVIQKECDFRDDCAEFMGPLSCKRISFSVKLFKDFLESRLPSRYCFDIVLDRY